jgi:hypothetical protein
MPLVPQEAAPWSVQTPRGSTAPAGTFAHEPFDAARLHAWQAPHPADPQHTPSTQLPLEHSAPVVHAVPFACEPMHRPFVQVPEAPQEPQAAPLGRGLHVPALPDTLHDWQAPQDEELQQTPSTQLPLGHWAAVVQEAPSTPAAQTPLLQVAPDAHAVPFA